MAGVFSAQWQNFWMDDEDVSLICVMSSFIVPPAPDIFFFFTSPEFFEKISSRSTEAFQDGISLKSGENLGI